ncbi:MAG TPA: TlpA disulfide reductase family protein [Bacteroidales bacterium]|nr:TlpA disulfide reductase family protein [Bacteroidales bacterium]HOS57169.1 TlpA disulfide reductase family protein [Bacteroidales bacterium]HRR03888.1 TlpA disulfide reductase family protein [Bacteroidales bacterium]HRT13789.1 TlpA disulfide reductase family protein [Bacteroidales bacterium]HXK73316.1 TlpA disulfide reductase family protein [Bacteroidales bacterium]
MKKIFFFILFCYFVNPIFSQEESQTAKFSTLPSVDIKTLDGKNFNTKDIDNEGKPIIISLWATWCRPCIEELTAIAELYEDWVEETGVKLYAISVDDSKTASRVVPFVNGRAWEYEVLQDVNSDFKRAMNVVDIPYLCVLNEKREIVWQHTSYAPGNENEIYEVVKKISNK